MGGTAGEGEQKEPSELDEDEGPGDGGVDARVGGGVGTDFVGAAGGAVAEDGLVCDDCAIRESAMQGCGAGCAGYGWK